MDPTGTTAKTLTAEQRRFLELAGIVNVAPLADPASPPAQPARASAPPQPRTPQDVAEGRAFLRTLPLPPEKQAVLAQILAAAASPPEQDDPAQQAGARAAELRLKLPKDPANTPPEQQAALLRGVDFALENGAQNLGELADLSDFYEMSTAEIVDSRVAAKLAEPGNTVSESDARAAIRRVFSDIHDGTDDARLRPAIYSVIAENLQTFKKAIASTGVGAGAIACPQDPEDPKANSAAIQALGGHLRFASVTAAALNSKGHYDELAFSEQIDYHLTETENHVLAYHNGARATVRSGNNARWTVNRDGSENHEFDGPSCTAVVLLTHGHAVLIGYSAR